MQPNQSQSGKQQMLSVDIQKVIEVEAEIYQGQNAALVRRNAVLSTALEDLQNENNELRAKLHAALGGGSPFGMPVAVPVTGVGQRASIIPVEETSAAAASTAD